MDDPAQDRRETAGGWLARAGYPVPLFLGLAFLVTYAYFVAPAAWNENSRFNLTRSVVERRQIDIDPYHRNTGDKAFRNGHYYSDKAPGTSFLAVLPYAAYYTYLLATEQPLPTIAVEVARAGTPIPTEDDRILVNLSFRKALYVCTIFTSSLFGALLVVSFFVVLCALGRPRRDAFLATLALGLGTLVFPYSTMLYGHVIAAALLFGAFALLRHAHERAGPGGEIDARTLALAGLLGAAAVAVEYPVAIGTLAVAAYGFSLLRDKKRIAFLALGGVGPALLLVLYQSVAFGSPVRPGYSLVTGDTFSHGMSQGLMGVTLPKADVLAQSLVGRTRGLLYVGPVLAFGFVGLWRLCRLPDLRREGVLAAGVVAYFLLMNSGYYMWTGGAAMGPRHVIPMIPFLALGVAYAVEGRPARIVALALGAISIFNHLVTTAVAPEAPIDTDPLFGHAFPIFFGGQVAVLAGTTNLGVLIGLPGPASLLPLLVVWTLTIRVIWPALEPSGVGRS